MPSPRALSAPPSRRRWEDEAAPWCRRGRSCRRRSRRRRCGRKRAAPPWTWSPLPSWRRTEHACLSLIVRGVSDDAREPLPAELLILVNDDGRLRTGGLFALAQPRLLRAALRLRRASREALGRVANALSLLTA